MAESILRLIAANGGWQLLDNGKPAFWFPERRKAVEIATIMADARNLHHGLTTAVESESVDGAIETLAIFR